MLVELCDANNSAFIIVFKYVCLLRLALIQLIAVNYLPTVMQRVGGRPARTTEVAPGQRASLQSRGRAITNINVIILVYDYLVTNNNEYACLYMHTKYKCIYQHVSYGQLHYATFATFKYLYKYIISLKDY